MIDTTIAAYESAATPETLSKKKAMLAATKTATLRSVSAITC